jgi:endonuclease/exonuclease/phosphatase family metal-dependent hydrolase
MRLVTWNVADRKSGPAQWEYVTGLKPDIVLLQECRPPSHYLAPDFPWEPIDRMRKGVGMYTNGLPILPIKQLSLDKFRGRLLVRTVTLPPGMQVVVICAHVNPNRHIDTTGKICTGAKEYAGRIFDALSSLLLRSPYVILAGDLNLTVHYSEADVPVRDRLVTEFGLVNCTKYLKDGTRLNKNEVSTLKGKLHQDDYIFVSPTFKVTNFDVLQDAELSNHFPVISDLSA